MARTRKITENAVLRELACIAFAELGEVRAAEKMKALELLGRHLGMWNDKAQISVTDGEQTKLGQLIALLGMNDEQPDADAVAQI